MLRHLVGCRINSMFPKFNIEMLIHLSKANLDFEISFGKITHRQDPKIRNMSERTMYRNENSTFWSMI